MAQNFWIAIFAWAACFVVTILVSLATQPRAEKELEGLVCGLTFVAADSGEPWYRRPPVLAAIVGMAVLALNIVYW